jgi:hypothetical protein
VFVAVAVFHAVFFYDWTWLRRRSDCKKIDMIPGPKTVPFFGNVLLLHLPEESKCFLGSVTKCSQNLHFSNT